MKVGVFDSESDGFLEDATRVWCLAVKDKGSGERKSFRPNEVLDGLEHLSTFDVLIGHNVIAHDFPLFRKLYKWEFKGTKVDTLLMSRMQRPERKAPPNCPDKRAPHSLNAWGYRLGHKKVEHEEWHQFSEAMMHRCEEDVELNAKVEEFLLEEGKGEGWRQAHMTNFKLFDLLQKQEEHGWFVDVPYMDACIRQLDRWIDRITNAIQPRLPLLCEPQEGKQQGVFKYVSKPFTKAGKYTAQVLKYYPDDASFVAGPFSRVGFRPIDLDSNAETKEYLLSVGWEPVEYNTNDKGEVTSPKLSKDDPFNGVQGSLGRLIAKRVKCRHRKGTLEGLRLAVDANSRIHPGINGIAVTGRMKHKLVVNLPSVDSGAFYGRQIRKCFMATPGWVMVGADSKGNQVRQLAARMGDDVFTKAVLFGTKEEDNDHHSLTRKASGVATRTLAKNVFYGISFGAGDAKIGKIVGGTKEDGARVKANLMVGLPKLAELLERLSEEWKETAHKYYNDRWRKWEYRNGYIRGLDGRPILVEFEKDLLVYALQSDEAIQMAYAYILVFKEMEKRGYRVGTDWRMLIWYHDEFQTETRQGLADELGSVMCWAIKQAGLDLNITCPHDGDYKIGNNWAETH